MKLNIGTKVNVLIIVALILVGGASLLLSIPSLKKGGELGIQDYRKGMIGEKKTQIQDLVNSSFVIAKERLDSSSQVKEKANGLSGIASALSEMMGRFKV